MSKRRDITDALNRLAFARELLGEDEGLAKVLSAGAWSLRQAGDLEGMHARGELASADLRAPVRKVVEAVLDDQPVPGLAELEARIPPGLLEVRKIRGLGAKKIRALWEGLAITSLAELEYACNENRLLELDGFGAKTQAKVLEGIEEVRKYADLRRLDLMLTLGQWLCVELEKRAVGVDLEITGQVRRGFETVDALELIAAKVPLTESQLELGLSKLGFEDPEVLPHADGHRVVMGRLSGAKAMLHLLEESASRGVFSVRRASSESHWAALRVRAEKLGLELSAQTLSREGAPVSVPSEDALYEALDLWPVPPERREEGVPLVPRSEPRPRLVRFEDLQGALHNHTIASDGTNTLDEMCQAASALGLSYLGITEHSQSAGYAGGLAPEAIDRELEHARRLDGEGEGCRVLYGIESDILADGSLDYEPELLSKLDLVVSSVHQRYSQDAEAMTARMIRAAENVWTDIIGHPTGRLLLGREPAPVDMEALLDACEKVGCSVELNANPARLDLNEAHLAMAKERGILVSISADAHSAEALKHLEYGVTIARRAGLSADDVLNARPYEVLSGWLASRKARARST